VWRRQAMFIRLSWEWVIVDFGKTGSKFIVETATKSTAFSCQKRVFYPVENFVDFCRFSRSFPRFFPRGSPQTVENSVDSFAKKWKKPRKSRAF
jgi:hypothetical protein